MKFLDLQNATMRDFFAWKMFVIVELMKNSCSEFSYLSREIVGVRLFINANAAVSKLSDGRFLNPISIFESSDYADFAYLVRFAKLCLVQA